jgi:acetyl esterase/lipase
MVQEEYLTLPYKSVDGNPINLDIYPPILLDGPSILTRCIPAVIYFHGGGLTVGNRRSWIPVWLKSSYWASPCMSE